MIVTKIQTLETKTWNLNLKHNWNHEYILKREYCEEKVPTSHVMISLA